MMRKKELTKEEYRKNIRKIAEIELLVDDILITLRKDIDREKERIKEEKDNGNKIEIK